VHLEDGDEGKRVNRRDGQEEKKEKQELLTIYSHKLK